MGREKMGTKGGVGFFHLFEWNRKSRKKLFSGGAVSSEETKHGKQFGDSLPASRLCLVDEDEIVGVPSMKGSSDYSCSSSVIDDEGNGMKAPGVVARLMGLDALPVSGVSEPCFTALFDSGSLRDNNCTKKNPEFYTSDQCSRGLSRAEGYLGKIIDVRTRKMPSSPIERFQTEILPPRSAKLLSNTHHKLLSPIRNPGFISPKNAAHIMEAAAKILDPGLQPRTVGRVATFGSSSVCLKVRDSKEATAAPQRTSKLPETTRRVVESSDVKSIKGQALNKSWNGSEDAATSRTSLDLEESVSACANGRGKSISLAIQAKVNVQRREGSSTGSRCVVVQKERKECKSNQMCKSQQKNQNNRQLKKASSTSCPSVLRQNNQKQNCLTSRHKLATKPSISNQQVRKPPSADASSGKNKDVSKLSGSSRIGCRKGETEIADLEREGLSLGNENFPRKKRLIERGFYYDRSGLIDDKPMDRRGKHVQPNVVIDEYSSWTDDNLTSGTDIVSFTFTSPMVKSMPGLQSSTQMAETQDQITGFCSGMLGENNVVSSNNKDRLSLRSNTLGGDALSILLEQKLRELTSRVESPCTSLCNRGSASDFAPVLQESQSSFDTPGTAPIGYVFRSCEDKLGAIFDCGVSLNSDQASGMNYKLQGTGRVESSCSSDTPKEPDCHHPSPLSTLEVSFSNESCNSSESWESTNESKICSSSVHSGDNINLNSMNTAPSVEADLELSDSASSFAGSVNEGVATKISRAGWTKESKQDLEYVKEILSNTGAMLKNAGGSLGPLLFDQLENKGTREGGDYRMNRKVLFDCVNECLDVKYSRYFQAGYRTWARGVVVIGKEPAEELYKEISGWKSMGDWMVDELVDKDMTNHLGRWVDFEIEAFEAGVEIEKGILSSLVDELVADISLT